DVPFASVEDADGLAGGPVRRQPLGLRSQRIDEPLETAADGVLVAEVVLGWLCRRRDRGLRLGIERLRRETVGPWGVLAVAGLLGLGGLVGPWGGLAVAGLLGVGVAVGPWGALVLPGLFGMVGRVGGLAVAGVRGGGLLGGRGGGLAVGGVLGRGGLVGPWGVLAVAGLLGLGGLVGSWRVPVARLVLSEVLAAILAVALVQTAWI